MLEYNKPKSVQTVLDPYSGKTYGNESYKTLMSNVSAGSSYYQGKLNSGHNTMGGSSLDQPTYSMLGRGQTPREVYTAGLSSFSRYAGLKEEDYVQRNQVVESFAAHGGAWDKYFKSLHQNPRIQEGIDEKAQGSQGAAGAFSSPLEIGRRSKATSVGTGIATSVKTNPFAAGGAGLGI